MGERERLLGVVRGRVDGVGGGDGAAALHTEEARGEIEALVGYLVGRAPDGAYGVDQEVAYTLGVAWLLRADDRREAPTAEQEARQGLLLLAPFHCHLPGTPDVLPPPLRAALDAWLGPGGGRPDDPAAIVQEHAASLVNVSLLLLELGAGRGRPEPLEAAATLTRQAMPYLSPEGHDRALALCNLGYALLLGSVHVPDGEPRLSEAVDVLRTALDGTPPDHPNRARCAHGLGVALLAWAGAREDRTPLPEAIDLLRAAARGGDPADDNVAQTYSDLGQALTAYAVTADDGEEVGPEVREEAVTALRRSLDLTGDGDTEALRERLDRLAGAALIGVHDVDRTPAAERAREAVEALRRLLGLTPVGDPARVDVLLRLAASLITAQEPQEAIDLLADAGPVFAGDAERTARAEALLSRAAVLKGELASRSDLTPGQREDWEAIDAFLRPVLTGEGGGDHPIAAVMALLGMGPQEGGSRSHELMEFGSLVLGYPEQVSLEEVYGKGLEMLARRIGRLPEEKRGNALARLLQGGDEPADPVPQGPADLTGVEELLGVHERLMAGLAPDTREYRLLKSGRSMLTMLMVMHESMDETQDQRVRLGRMRESLPLLREMFEELPNSMEELGISPELFAGHTALIFAQESPFDQLQALEEGVRAARRTLDRLQPGSPEYDGSRTALAISLFSRHQLWSEEADFTEAEAIARELTAAGEPDLRTVMLLARWTSAVQHRVQRGRLLGGGPAGAGRSPSLVTRLASEGAAKALDEDDPVEALETLEDGRAHLLSAALNARRELGELHGADAALHARLRSALDRIRELRRGAEPGHWPTPEEMAEQRAVTEDAARLITELQRRPGFQRFLTPLPLGLDDLRPAAAEGPVVSVNMHPRRCDALVLDGSGRLRTVRLPRLYASDLVAQAESFRLAVQVLTAGPYDPLFEEAREIFTGTLGWLWDVLAEPVLDALELTGPPEPGAPWPRLWWSPSGVLNAFPLHAAGHHGTGTGTAVLDRVASSYTPTLRALLFSRARRRAEPGRRGVLAVAMPETPGQAPLARTVAEATGAVAAGGGVPLIGAAATREAVRTAVLDAAVVHFACHAGGDPEDAADGRLLLADGDLRIADIADLRLEAAELAYLSACGTARGSAAPALADEVIHLASAFQLAGYTQSVATLWEVGDAFAADAAAAFHHTLAPSLPDPAPLPAALALHETVRALRAADPDRPWTWSALVHAGA